MLTKNLQKWALGIAVIPLSFGLFACKSKDNEENKSAATQSTAQNAAQTTTTARTPFSYNLNATNLDGSTCSTGEQVFSDQESLCMGLQDSVRNQECALTQRIELFTEQCEQLGMQFYESLNCRVKLYDANMPPVPGFAPTPEIDSQYLRHTSRFCTGRFRSGGTTPNGYDHSGVLFENIFINLRTRYHEGSVFRGQSNRRNRNSVRAPENDQRTQIQLQLFTRANQNAPLRPVSRQYRFTTPNIVMMENEALEGTNYRLYLACHTTDACDNPALGQ